MNSSHDTKTQLLSKRIEGFFINKKPFRVFHGSTNSTRILTFKQDEMIDISSFNEILSIDANNNTAVVEPNVPMDTLVEATLQYGLIPPIVMEFPGITVGGALQANGVESSPLPPRASHYTYNSHEVTIPQG